MNDVGQFVLRVFAAFRQLKIYEPVAVRKLFGRRADDVHHAVIAKGADLTGGDSGLHG